jgi:rhodanese-related sulfurtransferase
MVERNDVVVLDVRNPEEYAAGHIACSRHIPLTELDQRKNELPADRPVLVHCQGGARSAIAAGLLSAHGRNRVIDLQGGFAHWQAVGNPVERGESAALELEPVSTRQMEVETSHV